MKNINVTIIEDHSITPTEFGISFNGCNPEEKYYFKMVDGETADRLQNYLNNVFLKDTFESAVEPVIRYLLKNHNPHTQIHIDYSKAELLSVEKSHNLNNEIPD